MNRKRFLPVLIFLFTFFLVIPAKAQTSAPPADMFQLPWEQGLAWVAFDGFDNGSKRSSTSPHHFRMGGAVDFAPYRNMWVGMDTSNFWVTAAAGGVVTEISTCHIKITHDNGWTTEYWHLDKLQVTLGDSVYRNQRLAIIHDNRYSRVCTGNEHPGPHLHFVVRPQMQDVVLAGWYIQFNRLTNITTFKRGSESLSGPFKPILNTPALQIAQRGVLGWDELKTGTVDTYRYERWQVDLPEPGEMTFIAEGYTEGLTPLIVLLDAQGNEIARAAETLTSTQNAGEYYVQIQPQAGQGFYSVIAKRGGVVGMTDPYVSVVVEPSSVLIGGSAAASVRLHNMPSEGLSGVEFTCDYDPGVASVTNIAEAGLFGDDPAVAVNGPQNGGFVVAIAGSQGQKTTGDGEAFTFSLTGLQEGQTPVACTARISKGDSVLQDILWFPDSLSVVGDTVEPTPIPTITPPPTATPPPPPSEPTVIGQVFASKQVSISLFALDNSLVNAVEVDQDGIFSMTAPAGSYVIVASAEGFLPAQAAITLTDGEVLAMPEISLPAGDIDGNGVIDQFDALTIGFNYNASSPSAADLNNDGVIDFLDLELLAANYRKSGALVWQ